MLRVLNAASGLFLALVLAGGACLFPLVSVAQAEPAAPANPSSSNALFPRHAQMIYLTYSGQIRVVDPGVMPGEKAFSWDSGGYQGYTNLAVGDVNGDGVNEIVATRDNVVDVFNPRLPSGTFMSNVMQFPSGQNVRLLAVGDYNGDGRAEVAVHHQDTIDGNVETLNVYSSPNGVNWSQIWSMSYGIYWQALQTADVNGDGVDDLIQVAQNAEQYIWVLNGRDWPNRYADTFGYAGSWQTLATDNIFDHSGLGARDDLALLRTVDGGAGQLVFLRYDGSVDARLIDPCASWPNGTCNQGFWQPPFTSITLADVIGSGYKQPVLLRDLADMSRASLILTNPANVPGIPSFERAAGSWNVVRAGDLDGDGRDEIVIMRPDRYRIYDDGTTGYAPFPDVLSDPSFGTFNPAPLLVANVKGDGDPQGPTMSYSPKSLVFNQAYGDTPTVQTIDVTNSIPGTANISYTASNLYGTGWLRVNGSTGNTTGQTPGTVSVSYDYSTINPGTYVGMVRVSAADPTVFNGVANIPITLTLSDPGFLALPHSISRAILAGTVTGTMTGNVQVMNPSGTVSWIAFATTVSQQAAVVGGSKVQVNGTSVTVGGNKVDVPNWLSISSTTGTTPASLGYSISLAGLGVGLHQAFITVVPSNDASQSRTVAVSLSIANSIAYLPLTSRQ
jgi:hypothetical protein